MRPPDYQGGGLVNLIAELEYRLTGSAAAPRLRADLAARIPPAAGYVFVLIDGLGGHQLGHPAAPPGARVANTIFWFDPVGAPVEVDYRQFLPAPNLAERMSAAGVESIVVEPSAFIDSPLEQVLYRGAAVVPAPDDAASVRIALERAAEPGKLVVVYVPNVDAAA